MISREVGEIFQDKDNTLQVIESEECKDCHYLDKKYGYCNVNEKVAGECNWRTRPREDSVIFKLINKQL